MKALRSLSNFSYELFTKCSSRFRERERERERESRPLRGLVKFLFSFIFFVALFLTAHSSVYAATRYVNSDSTVLNGNNPTRAFNDPSYTANDSYQTFSAAFGAAIAGDTIELSGGTSGKSYAGHTSSINKQLTIRGSSISSFNGTVTITYNATSTYALGANADGIILQNLTFSGSDTGKPLSIYKNNITVTNVVLTNAGGDNYSLTFSTSAGYTTTLTNLIIYGNTVGRGITMGSNSGTANFYNCVINGTTNIGIYMNTGATANFTNCSFTADGTITSNMFYYNGGGTINTTNCLIQGTWSTPQTITGGSGSKTWNSTNDIIDGFPYYKATKANLGYLAFSTDDRSNLDYCVTNANYAMTNYSIPITCYISDTQNLTASDKTKLQALYKQGDEIGVHTRHHNDFSLANGITVTYSGSYANIAFVVSGSGTSLSTTGSGDTHGPIDLTNASYDTLGELCTTIATWSHYACSVITNINTGTLSTSLKDVSTSLPISTATGIPFDDSTAASNRYYTEEITNSINDLETALHLDPDCSSYTAKTIAFPYNTASNAVLTWIQAHTNLIGARSNDSVGTGSQKVWLGSINVYNVYNRPTASDFIGNGSQATIQKSARVLATYASNGYFSGMLVHTTSDMTNQQWAWMLDELSLYKTTYNLNINSFANLINLIKTSGNWTDAGSGVWTRTFSGSDDFRLTASSPMINTGTMVAGRTTDILGNPIVGTPDIGAYEFQAPTAPTSLAQYKSDGSTVISSGGWTNETSVKFSFSMSSTNASDSLTPYVEIRPNATGFTSSMTNSVTAVTYSGSPVTGIVPVTGLVDGTIYHWQVSANNAAATGSWVTKGGNPDFGVDTSGPTTPGTPTTTTPTSNNKPAWTWTASTDGSSGLPATPYTVQWCTDSGFSGCGANTSTSATNSFTHAVSLTDGTWYFRAKATDAVGNDSSYSSNGTVVVDTTAPTLSSKTTFSGWYTINQTSTFTYTDGSGSGIASGTPVTCSITTEGSAQTCSVTPNVCDAAGNCNTTPVTSNGANIDKTAPTSGSIGYTDGYFTSASVSLTVSDGTDTNSGVNTASRTFQRQSASLLLGICGIYGSFSPITPTPNPSYPSFTDTTVVSGNCYKYEYQVSDTAGNQATYTSGNAARIDTGNPSTPGTPSTTNPNNSSSQNWTWIAATDAISNVANYLWRTTGTAIASGSSAVNSVTTSLADGLYNFFVKAVDTAGNQGSESSVSNIRIDTTVPSVPGTPTTASLTTVNKPVWTWTASTDSGSGLAATPYSVQWCGNSSFTGCDANIDTATTNTYTHATALADGTWYFRVKTTDTANNSSAYSSNGTDTINTATTTTTNNSNSSSNNTSSTSTPSCTDQAPGAKAPWLYGAIAQDSGSVLLYFTEADNPVSKYVLEYGTKSGDYPYGVQDMGVNVRGQMTYLVKSLSPNTTYYFKVRGGNGCATGTWSNEISAKTKSNFEINQLNFTSSTLETVPVQETQPTTTNESCQTYTVKSGDTLWSISKNLLGDGNRYKDIIDQNKGTYPSLENSNSVVKGWELKVNCGNQSPPTSTTPTTPGAGETQKTNGTQPQNGYDVKVKVIDTSKNPVEGATVTIHSNPQTTKTDSNGVASFTNVEAGEHKVLIAYNSFQGEQTVNLSGNVKEFDLNVTVQEQNILLSPQVIAIIAVMGIIILTLGVLLIKAKKKSV
jgi:hypothetical protein